MNILVTGGAGFIGSHLVDALVGKGHRVRILDSLVEQVHGPSPPEHLNHEAEFIHSDLCDAEVVAKALDGIEVIYHQAAEVGVAQSMYEIVRFVRANDLGTAVLLQEIVKRRSQLKKLIVASSMSIYGEGPYRCPVCHVVSQPSPRPEEQLAAHQWEFVCDTCGTQLDAIGTPEEKPLSPTSVYAVNKQAQEQYCMTVGRAYDIPTVAFRYFNVYGTRQALSNPYTGVCAIFSARLLNDQAPVIFEDGGQSRDFVHVSDVAAANVLAMESAEADHHVVNIGSGKATSVKQIALTIAEGLNKDIEPIIEGKYRQGDIRHCIADISRARRLLNFEPKVSLQSGLNELLGWLSAQKPEDRVTKATSELAEHGLVR
ncbi:MAG: NAD-dependent epimerase/dehydratase family protein [Pyrinomonadaceae bacterium]